MNYRDKEKLNRATELAADSIYSVVDAYVRVLETLASNELEKYGHLPKSLHYSPTGIELKDNIRKLQNKINDAELILFSRVMKLSGKDDVFRDYF